MAKVKKSLRLERGLTQKDVAKRIGISQANIACYENGVYNPKLQYSLKLAALYNVTLDELFETEEAK